ncbi:class A beta-lactamase-related serine hydrolase [Brachybacterium sp. JHP9]|uniref:Class A beta-lactamase-related serine hydrolase n=1 Tax=Brachybacterium equifaecis TaxID=2910770 RepID=A0ABT0R1C4_9MICO|nr:serine hydrolase [Brachybacterium equifaecis]MCL6423203.1 class A beta-lactamase-related serine hydrolase [Brachybacterium equifaecis]
MDAMPEIGGPPRLSAALLGADGSALALEDADRPYYAASTMKLHVLIAVLEAADAGMLDLDASVPATRTFTGVDGAAFTLSGDHLDPTHPADGAPVAIGELARRMIDRSSNEATDQLIALVGLPAIARVIERLGLRATRVERMIGDPVALARGLTNETTAHDLARTVHALTCEDSALALSARSRELARSALAAQRIPIIAKAVRPGVPWGSKSGWIDAIRHDVAVVGEGAQRRVLAVLTSGMTVEEADPLIIARARELLGELAAQE